jgi:hypothetical protein
MDLRASKSNVYETVSESGVESGPKNKTHRKGLVHRRFYQGIVYPVWQGLYECSLLNAIRLQS